MQITITHQPEQHRFVFQPGDEDAVLEYRLLSGERIDFKRTYVPDAHRGKGIAEKLVRTGIAWARGQGLEMEASCWYARRFLRGEK